MAIEKYRTFWPRVKAAIIDVIIVFLPITFLDYWVLTNLYKIPNVFLFIWFIFSSFAYFIYSVLMHGVIGQTIGKMNCKIKVLDISENKLSFRQAFLRDSIPILLTLIAVIFDVPDVLNKDNGLYRQTYSGVYGVLRYISYIWIMAEIATMLFNEKRRAIHDFIAQSVVVKSGELGRYIPSEKETIFVLLFLVFIIFITIMLFIYLLIF